MNAPYQGQAQAPRIRVRDIASMSDLRNMEDSPTVTSGNMLGLRNMEDSPTVTSGNILGLRNMEDSPTVTSDDLLATDIAEFYNPDEMNEAHYTTAPPNRTSAGNLLANCMRRPPPPYPDRTMYFQQPASQQPSRPQPASQQPGRPQPVSQQPGRPQPASRQRGRPARQSYTSLRPIRPECQPAEPQFEPTFPGYRPIRPATQPTGPVIQPNLPGVRSVIQPTYAATKPTTPGVHLIGPAIQPTYAATQPASPAHQPTYAATQLTRTQPTPPGTAGTPAPAVATSFNRQGSQTPHEYIDPIVNRIKEGASRLSQPPRAHFEMGTVTSPPPCSQVLAAQNGFVNVSVGTNQVYNYIQTPPALSYNGVSTNAMSSTDTTSTATRNFVSTVDMRVLPNVTLPTPQSNQGTLIFPLASQPPAPMTTSHTPQPQNAITSGILQQPAQLEISATPQHPTSGILRAIILGTPSQLGTSRTPQPPPALTTPGILQQPAQVATSSFTTRITTPAGPPPFTIKTPEVRTYQGAKARKSVKLAAPSTSPTPWDHSIRSPITPKPPLLMKSKRKYTRKKPVIKPVVPYRSLMDREALAAAEAAASKGFKTFTHSGIVLKECSVKCLKIRLRKRNEVQDTSEVPQFIQDFNNSFFILNEDVNLRGPGHAVLIPFEDEVPNLDENYGRERSSSTVEPVQNQVQPIALSSSSKHSSASTSSESVKRKFRQLGLDEPQTSSDKSDKVRDEEKSKSKERKKNGHESRSSKTLPEGTASSREHQASKTSTATHASGVSGEKSQEKTRQDASSSSRDKDPASSTHDARKACGTHPSSVSKSHENGARDAPSSSRRQENEFSAVIPNKVIGLYAALAHGQGTSPAEVLSRRISSSHEESNDSVSSGANKSAVSNAKSQEHRRRGSSSSSTREKGSSSRRDPRTHAARKSSETHTYGVSNTKSLGENRRNSSSSSSRQKDSPSRRNSTHEATKPSEAHTSGGSSTKSQGHSRGNGSSCSSRQKDSPSRRNSSSHETHTPAGVSNDSAQGHHPQHSSSNSSRQETDSSTTERPSRVIVPPRAIADPALLNLPIRVDFPIKQEMESSPLPHKGTLSPMSLLKAYRGDGQATIKTSDSEPTDSLHNGPSIQPPTSNCEEELDTAFPTSSACATSLSTPQTSKPTDAPVCAGPSRESAQSSTLPTTHSKQNTLSNQHTSVSQLATTCATSSRDSLANITKTNEQVTTSEPSPLLPSTCESNSWRQEELSALRTTFLKIKKFPCSKCDETMPSSTFWVNVQSSELLCQNCVSRLAPPSRKRTIREILKAVRKLTVDSDSETEQKVAQVERIARRVRHGARTLRSQTQLAGGGWSIPKRRRVAVISSSDSEVS